MKIITVVLLSVLAILALTLAIPLRGQTQSPADKTTPTVEFKVSKGGADKTSC